MKIPQLIKLQKINSSNGNLRIFDTKNHISFDIKRIFILDQINDDNIQRGHHAHKRTEQLLVCLSGEIDFYSVLPNGQKFNFNLSSSDTGIYIPPNAWHYMKYKKNSIQLVCASDYYDEDDYLRTFELFKEYYSAK